MRPATCSDLPGGPDSLLLVDEIEALAVGNGGGMTEEGAAATDTFASLLACFFRRRLAISSCRGFDAVDSSLLFEAARSGLGVT